MPPRSRSRRQRVCTTTDGSIWDAIPGCGVANDFDQGFAEIPIGGEIAVESALLMNAGFHNDPADQLIVATAMLGGLRLATMDRKIIAWRNGLASCRCSTRARRPACDVGAPYSTAAVTPLPSLASLGSHA